MPDLRKKRILAPKWEFDILPTQFRKLRVGAGCWEGAVPGAASEGVDPAAKQDEVAALEISAVRRQHAGLK